jgi:hypothetical protein
MAAPFLLGCLTPNQVNIKKEPIQYERKNSNLWIGIKILLKKISFWSKFKLEKTGMQKIAGFKDPSQHS